MRTASSKPAYTHSKAVQSQICSSSSNHTHACCCCLLLFMSWDGTMVQVLADRAIPRVSAE